MSLWWGTPWGGRGNIFFRDTQALCRERSVSTPFTCGESLSTIREDIFSSVCEERNKEKKKERQTERQRVSGQVQRPVQARVVKVVPPPTVVDEKERDTVTDTLLLSFLI